MKGNYAESCDYRANKTVRDPSQVVSLNPPDNTVHFKWSWVRNYLSNGTPTAFHLTTRLTATDLSNSSLVVKECGLSGGGGVLSSGWPWEEGIAGNEVLGAVQWVCPLPFGPPPLSVYKMNVSSTHLAILFSIKSHDVPTGRIQYGCCSGTDASTTPEPSLSIWSSFMSAHMKTEGKLRQVFIQTLPTRSEKKPSVCNICNLIGHVEDSLRVYSAAIWGLHRSHLQGQAGRLAVKIRFQFCNNTCRPSFRGRQCQIHIISGISEESAMEAGSLASSAWWSLQSKLKHESSCAIWHLQLTKLSGH